MPIYKGSQRIAAIYKGSTAIGRVYHGSTLVYDSAGGAVLDPTVPDYYRTALLLDATGQAPMFRFFSSMTPRMR